MCGLRLTPVRHRQTVLTQSEKNSLNFDSRIKIPNIKLNCDNISEGRSLHFFFKNLNFEVKSILKNVKIFSIFKQYNICYIGYNGKNKMTCPQKYSHNSIL